MTPEDSFKAYWSTHFNDLRIPELDLRWVTPSLLSAVIKKLPPTVTSTTLGQTAEGRPIHMLQLGTGKLPVLAWAAMHGNETTALRGWLDLFMQSEHPKLKALLAPLLAQYTLYFIPMLNPDGAERYTRRNAQGLDMNRDARALQSPEMRVLLNLVKALLPVLAFNLHDQRSIFSVKGHSATVSFLSPAIDETRKMTPTRAKAMDLISHAYHQLSTLIPGQIGRYTDEYYPTAVGEVIQQLGIPTILVECGAAKNDPVRQNARMAMAVALCAFLSRHLANASPDIDTYEAIPLNEKNQVDILIKGVQIVQHGQSYTVDIALLVDEYVRHNAFEVRYKVEDFGDLRHLVGLETYIWQSDTLTEPPQIGQYADFMITTTVGRLHLDQGIKK